MWKIVSFQKIRDTKDMRSPDEKNDKTKTGVKTAAFEGVNFCRRHASKRPGKKHKWAIGERIKGGGEKKTAA